ncbi:MAG: hypothetical protein H0V17_17100 [Deltaproteobacteria bacterium]|nr:hypothetical protein [Deltaproteobacteria bacterium]
MTALRNVVAARDLGVRGSMIAVLVLVAGSAANAADQWSRRREIAANHRQAGWQ